MTYRLTSLALVGLLAACSQEYTGSYTREAGSLIDHGGLGAANEQNTAIMSGDEHYTYSLANRFASEVMTTVNFAFNSDVLDAGARDTLREQAHWIRQFPEVRFRVYGHTDAVGSNGYNKRLGLRRAKAVVAFLATQGVSTSRLEAMVSHGETQPVIVTEGRERRNRRTVTEVIGFVKSHPMVLDGKYAQIIYREYVKSGRPETGLSTALTELTTGND